MLYNARSLRNKTYDTIEFLKKRNSDFCCITESWLKTTDTAKIAEIKDLGYNVINCSRNGKRGGGIMVLSRPWLEVKMVKTDKYESFELCETSVKSENDLLRFSTTYRTGQMDTTGKDKFIEELQSYLSTLNSKCGKSIIWGDFNIHVEDENDNFVCDFQDVLECDGYSQIVQGPTHVSKGTIDLIFIKDNDFDNVDFINNFGRSHDMDSIDKSVKHCDKNHSLCLVHDIDESYSDHCFIELLLPFCDRNTPVNEMFH